MISLNDLRDEQRTEEALLSRALAAVALECLRDVSPPLAAASITDGYDDSGIDAIYTDRNRKEIIFIQSKWSGDGSKTIDQGALLKVTNGIRKIVSNSLAGFNDRIVAKKDDIQLFLDDADYRAFLVIVHISTDKIGTHPQTDIDAFIADMNDGGELFSFDVVGQKRIHDYLKTGQIHSVDVDVDLYNYGFMDEPQKTYYGQAPCDLFADIREKYSTYIFDNNIRSFLGDTNINTSIISTLKDDPESFFMLNNGVTAVSTNIERKAFRAGKRDHARLVCKNFQIINGAQTVGSCHRAKYVDKSNIENAYAFIKIIEIDENSTIADKITRSANTQNKIERKGFVSMDTVQKDLKTSLQISGVNYVIKSGEQILNLSNSFGLEEATHAIIAFKGDIDLAALAKREIGKIWESTESKAYRSLFNDRLIPDDLWKIVTRFRAISETAQRVSGANPRYQSYTVHGNIFIGIHVFNEIGHQNFLEKDLGNESFYYGELFSATERVINGLIAIGEEDYPGSYLAHLFRNAKKCKTVSEQLPAKIAKNSSLLLPAATLIAKS